MKRVIPVLIVLCCASTIVFAQDAKEQMQHEKEYSTVMPNPAFDKIKSLAGEWTGTFQGMTANMSYKVMSAGSSVLLVQQGEKPGDEMVTVFHPDGKDLLVTHYCSAKNQLRMKFVPGADPNVLRFTFLDATNLSDPKIGHMVGLTLRIVDPNHHIQQWTFSENGKEQSESFEIHRKM